MRKGYIAPEAETIHLSGANAVLYESNGMFEPIDDNPDDPIEYD